MQQNIAVAELDLDGLPGEVISFDPAPGGPPVTGGDVYALVRLHGRPVGTVLTRVEPGEDPAKALANAAAAQLAKSGPTGTGSAAGSEVTGSDVSESHLDDSHLDGSHFDGSDANGSVGGPFAVARSTRAGSARGEPRREALRVSVVVATRERSEQLHRALDSLLRQDHPDFEVVVVDNAPLTTATRDLVETTYAHRVRYVREPVPGLATAHNRGVAVADGEVLAFTDDDVIADPHWLTALTAPFAADPGLACATGLILPAQLRTPAQVMLESHGGFAKGFAARTYDPRRPPADEPLFPFTAGSYGSGANMAFRADALRAVGGFDPATGTGTPARGGDDLYAFVRILAAGHRLRYTPDALVWHHHRETWQDLENQAYGYGAGLTAFLTAILVRRPALLPALLARLPRGLARARAMTAHRGAAAGPANVPGQHGAQDHAWPRSLSRLERRGMLYGPLGYALARRRVRGNPLPWGER
ncbi:glycosyltransferase [Streptomyces sp. NPDC051219]|uniref:glycosyltransferase n=1 Tax=Streptomyces sp. NPDC051219 TaxID=3155283 RepID=UPI00343CB67C